MFDIEQTPFANRAIKIDNQVLTKISVQRFAEMNETERARMTELCTAIASEQDSQKMILLVQELNRLLATKQERLNQREAQAS
jgi:hypothetical protein